MQASAIHHINSGLIILSCIVAFFIPFELFLFSYAVLGPLHYLTEIAWLHRKNYFTKKKYDFVFLVTACAFLVYWNFFAPQSQGSVANIILFSVFASVCFVFIKDWLYRIVVLLLSLICIGIINKLPEFYTWVVVFLPTIIHVLVFTWAFMLFGVLKERSFAGVISILVLIVCSSILLLFQPQNLFYAVSEYSQKNYFLFRELNLRLITLFGWDRLKDIKELFTSNAGFVTTRFIAFAYTYHYLNWFSKTSVIKWHQVPKNTLYGTLLAWIVSILLYAFNYKLGFNVLFCLSYTNVFLEFPLNVVSFTGIGKTLMSFGKK